ncbi:MAG TPA: glycosyltransferase family 2 protein [Pyrinomonadaceae bacterium]
MASTISTAMCTYNGALFLQEQLASIAAQTRPPDELLVCDDFSSDETRQILEHFAAGAPFPVRLHFNKTNLGSNKNFEQAISLCEGDVIALCDHDDIWHHEKLAVMESVLAAQPEAALVFTNGDVVDENSQPANYTLWQGVNFGTRSQAKVRAGQAFEALAERASITGAAMAFRARFTRLVLPIPDGIGFVHDEWIALLIAASAKLAMVDKPLIKYRRHARQQIGVTQPSPKPPQSRIDQMREAIQRQNPFLAEIKKLQAIEDRLASSRDLFSCENAYRMVRDKIAHLEARASILERGLESGPSVLRELLTLRYHRYSRGLYSAVKDLRYLSSNRSQST